MSQEPNLMTFRGPIERHQGTIRVRVDVQREGVEYWARVVTDPIRPDSMPLASGPTRELAIHAACEKASIPPSTTPNYREKGKPMDKRPHHPDCFCYRCEEWDMTMARAAKDEADERLARAACSPSFCECRDWCRDGRDMMSKHHPRCEHYTPPPADPRFARFGEAMWKYITKQGGDFCGEEISEDILPLAQAAGLCCRVEYDPETHGEGIEADPGDEIWWWGDFDWMSADTPPQEPS